MRATWISTTCALALLGCTKSDRPAAGQLPAPVPPVVVTPHPTDPTPTPVASKPTPPAPDPAATPALPPLPTVPAFSAAPVDQASQAKSDELLAGPADSLLHGGLPDDPAESKKLFDDLAAALIANPGNVRARFFFACGANQRGEVKVAVAELAELEQAGCPLCLSALGNVTPGALCDWAAEETPLSPELTAVTTGFKVPAVDQAFRGITAAFGGSKDKAKPFVDAGPVKLVITDSLAQEDDKPRKSTLKGVKAVLAFITPKDGDNPINAGFLDFCDGTCCEVDRGSLNHNTLFLNRMCFSAGDAPKLRSMDLTDGD